MKYPISRFALLLSALQFSGCLSTDLPVKDANPENTNRNSNSDSPSFPNLPTGVVKQGLWTKEDGTTFIINYQEVGEYAVIEGDIIIARLEDIKRPEGKALSKASSLGIIPGTSNVNRWPNKEIPYTTTVTGELGWQVTLAVNYWNKYMPVKFVPRSSQAAWVRFQVGGCNSYVGKFGTQPQPINVSTSDCGDPAFGGIMHEMGHAAGLYHEQQRNDRDTYVKFYDRALALINSNPTDVNFGKKSLTDGQYFSTPYDFGSLMHYSSWCFGFQNPANLRKANGSFVRNNLWRPSFLDVKGIANMYGVTKKYMFRQTRLRDYDGNKVDDLLFADGNGAVRPYLLSGSTPASVTGYDAGNWITGFGNLKGEYQSGDFNGDGRADILWIDPSNNSIRFAFSDGARFNVQPWTVTSFGTLTHGGQYRVGDFNGDQKDDIAFINPIDNTVQVALSNGAGFPTRSVWVSANTFGSLNGGGEYYVGKFNADNRSDLLFFDPSNGSYKVNISQNSKFVAGAFSPLYNWIGEVNGSADLLVTDLISETGSGREELLVVDPWCHTNDPSTIPAPLNCVFGVTNQSTSFGGSSFTAIPSNGFGGTVGQYFTGQFNTGDTREDILYFQPGSDNLFLLFSNGTTFGNFKVMPGSFGSISGHHF